MPILQKISQMFMQLEQFYKLLFAILAPTTIDRQVPGLIVICNTVQFRISWISYSFTINTLCLVS